MPQLDSAQLSQEIHAAVQPLRIIQMAMAFGVTAMAGVAALLNAVHHGAAYGLETAQMVSFAHLGVLPVAYFLAATIPPRAMRAQVQDAAGSGETVGIINALRTMVILRLALMELPALLGCTATVLSASQGLLGPHPELWANLFSAGVLVVFVGVTFPSDASLTRMVDDALRS